MNGVWIPIAEEFVWRGVIQTKLSYHMNPWIAIIITSVFFSIKHAAVDLVLTRLLFVIGFGLCSGWVKQRLGTHASTATHIYINFVGTLFAVLTGMFD